MEYMPLHKRVHQIVMGRTSALLDPFGISWLVDGWLGAKKKILKCEI